MWQDLLSSKMNRREFLGYTAALIMTITGISGVMRALMNHHPHRNGGYGSSSYGGGNRNLNQPRRAAGIVDSFSKRA